jgi:hypothetical protein
VAGALGKTSVAPLERTKILIQVRLNYFLAAAEVQEYVATMLATPFTWQGKLPTDVLVHEPWLPTAFQTHEVRTKSFYYCQSVTGTRKAACLHHAGKGALIQSGCAQGRPANPDASACVSPSYRVQTGRAPSANVLDVLRFIFRSDGILGFFRCSPPDHPGMARYSHTLCAHIPCTLFKYCGLRALLTSSCGCWPPRCSWSACTYLLDFIHTRHDHALD